MGIFKTVLLIIGLGILVIFFAIGLMIPYAFGAIAIAFISILFVCAYFLHEDISLSNRSVLKTFYCPFKKIIVKAKFRPSIFTYREFDDVISCSAFKGKVNCKKMCLDLKEHVLNKLGQLENYS